MRIFKREDKPATVAENAPVLGDSFFDRLLRQQLSRKHIVRDPLTGELIDLCERYDLREFASDKQTIKSSVAHGST